jgi:hypothetical protein
MLSLVGYAYAPLLGISGSGQHDNFKSNEGWHVTRSRNGNFDSLVFVVLEMEVLMLAFGC